MADEVFKNIRVLRGLTVDQFMGTMVFIAAASSMHCASPFTRQARTFDVRPDCGREVDGGRPDHEHRSCWAQIVAALRSSTHLEVREKVKLVHLGLREVTVGFQEEFTLPAICSGI